MPVMKITVTVNKKAKKTYKIRRDKQIIPGYTTGRSVCMNLSSRAKRADTKASV